MSRIKHIREARGLDPHKLAREIGVNSAWYYDLESEREDWSDEISIQGLRKLARALDVSPSSLLRTGNEVLSTPSVFVEHLRKHLESLGVSALAFSERIGWDVTPLFEDPGRVGELNATGLRAICAELGLDWLVVIDEMQMSAP
jgi:transcriptional regulator with XRE-family HTH domain